MSQLNLALAIAASTVLLLGLASGFVKNRLWISEPLIAMLVGILAGPAVFQVASFSIPEEQQARFLLEFARLTLAISIMAAALRLPYRWERKHWRELAVVLGLGMPLMWMASSLFAWAMLGLPVLYALLIGAVLSPTDPVLADSIVTGAAAARMVPARMRNTITAESGANDGLGMLFVMLPVYFLQYAPTDAVSHWLYEVLLLKVLAGIAVGLAIGWLTAGAFLWVLSKQQSERPSVLTLSLSLALAVLAIDLILGTDSLLAVFAAGLMFNRGTAAHEEVIYENMQSAVSRFFDLPIFIFLGTMLPWDGWADLGWQGAAFALAVLLLRRLPVWLLIRPLLSSVRSWGETAFSGWFGPIGIAAIFYATELQQRPGIGRPELIWHTISLVVFASIVAHGITATPLTFALGRTGGRETVKREQPEEKPDTGADEDQPPAGRRSTDGRRASDEDADDDREHDQADQTANEDRAP